jgi:dihydrofolate synthase/folylpolyglutamate synthase
METNYAFWVDWLFSRFPAYQNLGAQAYKPGLERVISLLETLHIEHKKIPSIHIAGTNGKGSTAAYCASLLQEKGLRVGLFTSPHIFDFSERIRVNGEPISQAHVIGFCEQYQALKCQTDASFFELTFAMALDYFFKKQCDYIVIETGLGGRLDATNIIEPKVSVITNIAFDHQAFLGDTLQQIATEKAGIIKANTPVVIGEKSDVTQHIFIQKSTAVSAPIYFATDLDLNIEALPVEGYQKQNLQTALLALKLLDFKFDKAHINAALQHLKQNTGFFGRFQVISKAPMIVVDVSHNVAGIHATLPLIEQQLKGQLYILYGASQDKDAAEILALFPKDAKIAACVFSNPRSKSIQDWQALGIKTIYADLPGALQDIQKQLRTEDFLWITGSFFLLSDLPEQKKIF